MVPSEKSHWWLYWLHHAAIAQLLERRDLFPLRGRQVRFLATDESGQREDCYGRLLNPSGHSNRYATRGFVMDQSA